MYEFIEDIIEVVRDKDKDELIESAYHLFIELSLVGILITWAIMYFFC